MSDRYGIFTRGSGEPVLDDDGKQFTGAHPITLFDRFCRLIDGPNDAVEETAAKIGGDVRSDYSGRGMYGKECYGIVCNDPTRCIEVAAKLGLSGARVDGMGKRAIVYWPRVSL